MARETILTVKSTGARLISSVQRATKAFELLSQALAVEPIEYVSIQDMKERKERLRNG